ncbi:MAG TPA: phasin family protein [Steroidobacteraceae bacterium]|nr:phasin family protein [Steroidobacteraceae bacterium]
MATRSRKKASAGKRPGTGKRGGARAPTVVIEGVQQIWLAGMGAIARAQKEGPAAFQDAVADGLKLLNRSRSAARKIIQDAFEDTQVNVQGRLESAREQAGETWDNLELLFQNRVQRALQQLGVPNADEIRLLARRVAELNENVVELTRAAPAGRGKTRPAAGRGPAPKKASSTARRKAKSPARGKAGRKAPAKRSGTRSRRVPRG